MKRSDPPLTPLLSHGEKCRLIGKKARALRKQRRISRPELSEMTGVSVSTISRFENSGVTTISVLLKIAEALDALSTFNSLFAVSSYDSLEDFERANS